MGLPALPIEAGGALDVLHPKCAGLDVHKRGVVACVRLQSGANVKRETREFGTATADLEELARWLIESGCTIAVLESTGPYWHPVWNVLESQIQLVLANARDVKNVPGRKTDVSDAAWLADLLAHGLVRPSFVPDREQRELRALTRTRK